MNRVSEALKGKKVNQACQAWMGWMPLVQWYDNTPALSISFSLSFSLSLSLSLPDACGAKHGPVEPAEGSHAKALAPARTLLALMLTPD